jgi:hypothetical protein
LGYKKNAAPVAAVASVRPAPGDVFFTSETATAVAARASGDPYSYAIDKHRFSPAFAALLGFGRDNVHALALFGNVAKLHDAVRKRKKRMIFPNTHVLAGTDFCSALANEDIAAANHFAAEFLNAKPLRSTVAAIA